MFDMFFQAYFSVAVLVFELRASHLLAGALIISTILPAHFFKFYEIGFCYGAQAGLKLTEMLLPQPPEC
jgi:hypothetical protein